MTLDTKIQGTPAVFDVVNGALRDQRFRLIQRMTLGVRRTKGTSVVLMLVMELGAIEGSTDAKADHPHPQNPRPPLNSSNCWSLHSLAD
jgi:hypothetical protein